MTMMSHRDWAQANALSLRLVLAEVRYGGDSTLDEAWLQASEAVIGEIMAEPHRAVRVLAVLASIAAHEMEDGWDGDEGRSRDEVAARIEAEILGMLDAVAKAEQ